MTTAIIITVVALFLVVGGVVALVPGLLKLVLSTLGNVVAWFIAPIVKLFRKGGNKAERAERKAAKKSKPGVEEVHTPDMGMAAAAA